MKKILSIALTAAMLGGLCACGSSSPAPETEALQAEASGENAAAADGKNYDKVSLKLSYATGDTGMDGLTAIEFERLVEEKSGGQVQIDRFPNCQLSGGDMVRHVEMMIAGGAFEIAIISENSFSDVDQTFQVTSIPFTFANYDQAWEKADSTGGEFSKELFSKYGVVYLSTFPNGIMQFANNKRELHTPADMVNLKMRTYGDLQMSLMRSLGADPTQLSWSELYSALQTGAVDGNMNGYQTLYSGSLHEVQPYITEVNATLALYDFLANQAAWEKLSPDTQALLRECADEAAKWGRNYMSKTEAEVKKEMIDYGVKVYVPTEEELLAFKEGAALTIEEYKKIVGPEACAAWGVE